MLPEKCATSTVRLRFQGMEDVQFTWRCAEYEKLLKKPLSKHLILKDVLCLDDFQKRNDYLKACFVRNPYDRIYSLFSWIVNKSKNDFNLVDSGQPIRGVSPEQTSEYAKKAKRILKRHRKLEAINFDFNRYLPRKAKRFRNISCYTHHKGIAYMDFIGRVESFEIDFAALCQKIDFHPKSQNNKNVLNPETIEKERAIDLPTSFSKYTPKSIRIVNRICADDFENFGYKKFSPKDAPLTT